PHGTRYALLCGVCVAAYSILDKRGVAYVHPLLYAYCLSLGATIGLVPLILPLRQAVAAEWRRRPRHVVGVGLLSPLAYGLVLVALTFSPVSYIAPAREVSVVIAALMGSLILREPSGRQRLFGAALV